MNALTTQTQKFDIAAGMLDPTTFEHMQRVGGMLALSPLFPQHLRQGDRATAIANGVLVVDMAIRLRENPLTVAQNIYFVGGRPGWSSSYMIGKANQHGVFRDPIDWEITGKGDTLSVTAFAVLAKTGRKVSTTCDMAMAKAEGWTKNPKYTSMPATMLRYRSASALIRFYCPEVMIGLPSDAEVEMPMRDITPEPSDLVQTALERQLASREDNANRQAMQDARDAAAKKSEVKAAAEVKPEPEAVKEEPKADDRVPDPEQFLALYDMIITDLEASSVEDVESMYGPQIEQMQAAAPDLHKKLMAAFAERNPA